MPRTSVIYEHARKVLADGRWHDFDEVLYKVMQGVPPNIAVRVAEEHRIKNWLKDHPEAELEDVPPRKRNTALEQQVRIGARALAKTVLYTEGFDIAENKDLKMRIIRIFNPEHQVLPAGYVRVLGRRSRYEGMTPKEIGQERRARARKAVESRWRSKGIDPATHKTNKERNEERKQRLANMTPEELRAHRSAITRKGWETKRRRENP